MTLQHKVVVLEKNKELLQKDIELLQKDNQLLRVKLKDTVRKHLWSHRKLNMRGMYVYALTELFEELSLAEQKSAGSCRREMWRAILAARRDVMRCIKEAGPQWENVDTAADSMRDLYNHMSKHIKEYDSNPSPNEVVIDKSLLKNGQDVVLKCLGDLLDIPYEVVDTRTMPWDGDSD